MSQNDRPSGSLKNNALVIAALVVAALALAFIAIRNRQNGAQPTQEDITRQIEALQTAAPEAAAPPEATAAPQGAADEAEAYLFIILNNRVWGIEPLGEERDVTVDQGDGVVNVIHLLPDGFYMASSTCDNQLCVYEGTVTVDNYQRRILGTSVLCLPHNLDLELVVPNHTPDPDAPDV